MCFFKRCPDPDLHDAHDSLVGAHERLKVTVEEQEGYLARCREQAAEEVQRLADAREALEALRLERGQEEQKLRDVLDAAAEAASELDETRVELDETRAELDETQCELEAALEATAEAAEECGRVEKELADLKEAATAAVVEKDTAVRLKDAAETRAMRASQDAELLERKNSKAREVVVNAASRADTAEKTLAAIRQATKEAVADRDAAVQAHSAAQKSAAGELYTMSQRLDEAKRETAAAERKLARLQAELEDASYHTPARQRTTGGHAAQPAAFHTPVSSRVDVQKLTDDQLAGLYKKFWSESQKEFAKKWITGVTSPQQRLSEWLRDAGTIREHSNGPPIREALRHFATRLDQDSVRRTLF